MAIFRDDIVALVPHLRAFARTLTGGDSTFADDLVQDTIVNALQAQHQFTPGTNLQAWMFTILRNRFRSLIARKHMVSEISEEDLEDLSWVGPAQDVQIEVALFKRAFSALVPAQREVLVLAGVHGLSYERIAEICGCEVGTVKSRVSRARKTLKLMLMGEQALPPPSEERSSRAEQACPPLS